MSGRVLVVGSINVDLVVDAARLPAPGETVLGGTFAEHPGGKGANQAVAAARAGAAVRLIGAVGRDAYGVAALAALEAEGIDVSGVGTRATATGVALIVVDGAGENQIVVAPGANGLLSAEDVLHEDLGAADVVLTGFEVPMPAAVAAVLTARERRIPAIVNAAPAMPIPPDLERAGALFVLNEHEVAAVGEGAPGDDALQRLAVRTGAPVVVTRGPAGAVLARGSARIAFDGFPAGAVVDTTGAGDALIGVLAAWLAMGRPLEEAILAGLAAGSLSVGRSGARGGMPSRAEVVEFLAAHPR